MRRALSSVRHPNAALWAIYANGELTLECADCGRHMVTHELS
jgi:hypothetical protein